MFLSSYTWERSALCLVVWCYVHITAHTNTFSLWYSIKYMCIGFYLFWGDFKDYSYKQYLFDLCLWNTVTKCFFCDVQQKLYVGRLSNQCSFHSYLRCPLDCAKEHRTKNVYIRGKTSAFFLQFNWRSNSTLTYKDITSIEEKEMLKWEVLLYIFRAISL